MSQASAEELRPEKLAGVLGRLYSQRFSEEDRRERARLWAILFREHLDRYIDPEATVLDLGAGSCEFINQVKARRRIAIDLNPDVAHYAAPGVEVHAMELEGLEAVVGPATVDVAFASNVFEHLRGPDSLIQILGAVHRSLKPGGQLLILQPNIRAVGLAFWDFVDHTLPLTEKGMAEALGIAGLEVVHSRARFLPYTTKSRWPKWSWLAHLYLKLRPIQWLFGKQMFVVARKAG